MLKDADVNEDDEGADSWDLDSDAAEETMRALRGKEVILKPNLDAPTEKQKANNGNGNGGGTERRKIQMKLSLANVEKNRRRRNNSATKTNCVRG